MIVQPKFEYDAVQYKYEESQKSMDKIKELLTSKGVEILKVETDNENPYPSPNWEMYLFTKNSNWELDIITLKDRWYIWVDELNLVNSASPEYIEQNYIVKD